MDPFESPTPHQIREIAVVACVCERTVRRHLTGGLVRPSGRARITEAIERLGINCSLDHRVAHGASSDGPPMTLGD